MSTQTNKIASYLQAHFDTGRFMGSVLVGYRGEVLFKQGYGKANLEHDVLNTPQTKFRLASITKHFTASAIIKLQEQNLLQTSDPIAKYLSNYPQGDRITIHQLLNHTSGIPNFTFFDDYHPVKKRLPSSIDDFILYFQDKDLEFTPGDRFSYSNSGYTLLTKIIELVSDESYESYLQKNFFRPLQMEDSGYDRREKILPNRASGYVRTPKGFENADYIDMSIVLGAGGLYSTVEDLYKWEKSLFTDRILSQDSRKLLFNSRVRITYKKPPKQDNIYNYPQLEHSYGCLRDCMHDYERISFNGGVEGFVTHMARYPAKELAIIALLNISTGILPARIATDIAAIVFDKPYKTPSRNDILPNIKQFFRRMMNPLNFSN